MERIARVAVLLGFVWWAVMSVACCWGAVRCLGHGDAAASWPCLVLSLCWAAGAYGWSLVSRGFR